MDQVLFIHKEGSIHNRVLVFRGDAAVPYLKVGVVSDLKEHMDTADSRRSLCVSLCMDTLRNFCLVQLLRWLPRSAALAQVEYFREGTMGPRLIEEIALQQQVLVAKGDTSSVQKSLKALLVLLHFLLEKDQIGTIAKDDVALAYYEDVFKALCSGRVQLTQFKIHQNRPLRDFQNGPRATFQANRARNGELLHLYVG